MLQVDSLRGSVIDSTQLAELVEFGEAGAYTDMFAAAPMDWDLRVERFARPLRWWRLGRYDAVQSGAGAGRGRTGQ
jgi:hypothetical protein